MRRIVICGAAGRDFHNFNTVFRDDPRAHVVAFTAAQIPDIDGRRYPPQLAGARYPDGIPILPESALIDVIRERDVDSVVFAYSDVAHAHVMHIASEVLAAGANFELLGARATCLRSAKPVVAVGAVRTGCGKSQIARHIVAECLARGLRAVAIRHPMPYGDLARQTAQRFARSADFSAAHCTIEEREEYEPYVAAGSVVFAGVDYEQVLRRAEEEAEVIVWDGGNNDFPFVRPDLLFAVADALRPEQLDTHHPGETVLRMADVVVLNKAATADRADRDRAIERIRALRPDAPLLLAASPVAVDAEAVRGARVLIVEDGPTLTHGGMSYGAGYEAVRSLGVDIVDPRTTAHPDIRAVFEAHPHIGPVLPAMGYSGAQRRALRATVDASDADVVVAGTPIDLAEAIGIDKPVARVRYEHKDLGEDTVMAHVDALLARRSSA